jgi:nucleoside-diphosphate-sugar epimerase
MSVAAVKLEREKILITGPTSQVAFPLARELAKVNDVYGLARFGKASELSRARAAGIKPIQADLASDSLESLPDDFTYVLNFAVVKSSRFEYALAANAEGVGRLMHRCRGVKAFFHCSSAAVYAYQGHVPAKETDPLGDNHHAMLPTYSISKIAAETMVRFASREWQIPTTIVRFSVPYGDNGGWPWFHLMMMHSGHPIPVHPDKPNTYNPIHEDDYIRQLPTMLAIAGVPPTTVNWGGKDTVSVEEWTAYLGELTGLSPRFNPTRDTIGPLPIDLTRMHELVGPTEIDWHDGFRRMVEALSPELLKAG